MSTHDDSRWSDARLESYAAGLARLCEKTGLMNAFVTAVERLREAKARIAELEGVERARQERMEQLLNKVRGRNYAEEID